MRLLNLFVDSHPINLLNLLFLKGAFHQVNVFLFLWAFFWFDNGLMNFLYFWVDFFGKVGKFVLFFGVYCYLRSYMIVWITNKDIFFVWLWINCMVSVVWILFKFDTVFNCIFRIVIYFLLKIQLRLSMWVTKQSFNLNSVSLW